MKTLLTSVLLSISILSQAQMTSGKIFLSGYGNYTESKELKRSLLELQPTIGHVLTNNLVTGLTLSYSRVTEISGFSIRNLGIGPMVRYYIGDSKVRLFPHAEMVYNFYYDPYNGKTQNTSATGAIGLAYFVNDNASIELMGGLAIKDPVINYSNTFKIRFGFSVFFGEK